MFLALWGFILILIEHGPEIGDRSLVWIFVGIELVPELLKLTFDAIQLPLEMFASKPVTSTLIAGTTAVLIEV